MSLPEKKDVQAETFRKESGIAVACLQERKARDPGKYQKAFVQWDVLKKKPRQHFRREDDPADVFISELQALDYEKITFCTFQLLNVLYFAIAVKGM